MDNGELKIPSRAEHDRRANRFGISKWFVRVNGRRRLIEVEKFKGRLYVGSAVTYRLSYLIKPGETLASVVRKFGKVSAK